jgi:hypothetical protein
VCRTTRASPLTVVVSPFRELWIWPFNAGVRCAASAVASDP